MLIGVCLRPGLTHASRALSSIMSKKAVVLLATGAEEIEAVSQIDILRRGQVDVTVAGVEGDAAVRCRCDMVITPDVSLEEAMRRGPYDAVVLPGGLKGSQIMAQSRLVGELLKEQHSAGRLVAAICAAPTALKAHSIGLGSKVTCYPAMSAQMVDGDQYRYVTDDVVVDGNLITSRGPATAMVFALRILEQLCGRDRALEVAAGLLFNYS